MVGPKVSSSVVERSAVNRLVVGSNPTYLRRFQAQSLVSPVFCATFFLDPAKFLKSKALHINSIIIGRIR
jgi:hypothetical protein